MFPGWEHRGQRLTLKLWCNCQHPCGSFLHVNNLSNYIFTASLNQMRKQQPRVDIRINVYIHLHIFICLCVCVLPYVYILTEPRTTGTRVRFLHVLLGLLQPCPKHIRDDDNNGATHREVAEMRRLLGPDTEGKPRVTTLCSAGASMFYCSSTLKERTSL